MDEFETRSNDVALDRVVLNLSLKVPALTWLDPFLSTYSKFGNLMARFAFDVMASDDVEKSLLDRHDRRKTSSDSLQCWAGVLVALLVVVAVLAVLADHPAQPLSGSLSLIDVAQHWVPVTRAGDRVRPIPRAEAWCDPVVFGAHCTGGNRRAT
jgi:hypothetical protein